MIRDELIKLLNCYKNIALRKDNNLKIALIVSVIGKTNTTNDFKNHSVTTAYLTAEDCNELINALRLNGFYVELYTDFETFLKDYYNGLFNCNFIFESSPKGIAKGKDALLPSFCDSVGLKHIGPDGSSCLRCCNKYMWYCALKYNNLPVPDTYLYIGKWVNSLPNKGKYIIKLNEECASIGLSNDSVITDNTQLIDSHCQKLFKSYSEPVIVQKFIDGYEIEVPVLSNRKKILVLPPIGLKFNNKIVLDDAYFDYDTIYDNGYGTVLFENINKEISDRLINIAYKAIEVLQLQGYFRVDFRVDKSGNPYIIDINNDPTLNEEGSYQCSFKALNFDLKDVLAIIIGNALINQSNIEYQ